MKYSAPIGAGSPEHKPTPQEAISYQLAHMVEQVRADGISTANRIPLNRTLLSAYKKAGIKPGFDDVIDYNPIDVITFALHKLTGQRPKEYQRTFAPGQGEGTHTDPHTLVVTYTHNAVALFSLAGKPATLITPHHIVAFDGTNPHEVSMPLGSKSHRTISAFGVNL